MVNDKKFGTTLDLISRSIRFCLRNGQEETIKVNGRNRQVYEI